MARPVPMLSLEEVRPRPWEILLLAAAAALVVVLALSLSMRPTYRLEVVESAPGRLVLAGAGAASLLSVGERVTARAAGAAGTVELEGIVAGYSPDGLEVRVLGPGTAPAGTTVLVDGPEVRAVAVLASRIMP